MKTIYEIAELAGVSKSTVSRVLNNNGYVSQEIRDKVNQIVQETGYKPSVVARSLSKQVTRSIGVVIPEMSNIFFSEVISGISEVCDQLDWSLIYCDTSNDIEKEDRALRALGEQRVRGLIFVPAGERNSKERRDLEDFFNELHAPVVLLDRHLDKSRWGGVYYENEKSGYIATKELIKGGNKRIGIITGDLKLQIARERYQGFLKAMVESGLTVEQKFVLKGDFSVEKAYELTKKMLDSKDIPEAIVTCNNLTSLGFLKAVREKGKRIGRDIAVIGIDKIEILDILDYNFSVIGRDTQEMGRTAMRLLQDLVEHNVTEQKVQMIPCTVNLKGSEQRVLK